MKSSYPLNPELFIVPKGFAWRSITNTISLQTTYTFFGIGQDISPIVFADGVNEMGFAAAALYFPGYAYYDPMPTSNTRTPCVAAIELVNFLLGSCASVEQAASLLNDIRIVGTKDTITNSIAPLHWIVADQNGACAVIEKTQSGLHILDNPLGVLSNSPDFPWHMTNLRNYMNVEASQKAESTWSSVHLTPFGQGGGTFGSPGDYTPLSRFVRTAYHKSCSVLPPDSQSAVTACFHIMDSVSIPKGSVMTDRGTPDYTQYTAFISLSTAEYYFKTYDDSRITTARLEDYNIGSSIHHLGPLIRPVIFNQIPS